MPIYAASCVYKGQTFERFKNIDQSMIRDFSYFCEELARELFHKEKLECPRKNPEKVTLVFERLDVNDGKLCRHQVKKMEYPLPLERMESEEYNEKMEEILDGFPDNIKSFIRSESWERGHSSGYEEVLQIADDLASKLQQKGSW
jgi:hypothetical protein